MKCGITVQVRCSRGDVAFQSAIEAIDESIVMIRKELRPGETWIWKTLPIEPDKLAFFAAQTQQPTVITINGQETVLEGQLTTDFGIFFARRGDETLGQLPFSGTLTEVRVRNASQLKSRIDFMLGQCPDPEPVDEFTDSDESPEEAD